MAKDPFAIGQPDMLLWEQPNEIARLYAQQAKHAQHVKYKPNALKALGALLIVTAHFYARTLAVPPATILSLKNTTQELQPEEQTKTLWYYLI